MEPTVQTTLHAYIRISPAENSFVSVIQYNRISKFEHKSPEPV